MVQKVEGGIFIDYGCNGILKIGKGVFIPTGCRTSDTDEEFQKDLEAFMDKWFGPNMEQSSQGHP